MPTATGLLSSHLTPTYCHTRGVIMTPHSCLGPSHPDARPQKRHFQSPHSTTTKKPTV